jgi:hypothetical protein
MDVTSQPYCWSACSASFCIVMFPASACHLKLPPGSESRVIDRPKCAHMCYGTTQCISGVLFITAAGNNGVDGDPRNSTPGSYALASAHQRVLWTPGMASVPTFFQLRRERRAPLCTPVSTFFHWRASAPSVQHNERHVNGVLHTLQVELNHAHARADLYICSVHAHTQTPSFPVLVAPLNQISTPPNLCLSLTYNTHPMLAHTSIRCRSTPLSYKPDLSSAGHMLLSTTSTCCQAWLAVHHWRSAQRVLRHSLQPKTKFQILPPRVRTVICVPHVACTCTPVNPGRDARRPIRHMRRWRQAHVLAPRDKVGTVPQLQHRIPDRISHRIASQLRDRISHRS